VWVTLTAEDKSEAVLEEDEQKSKIDDRLMVDSNLNMIEQESDQR
jgi:hypothetical protein